VNRIILVRIPQTSKWKRTLLWRLIGGVAVWNVNASSGVANGPATVLHALSAMLLSLPDRYLGAYQV
jgi:hypothetical protein